MIRQIFVAAILFVTFSRIVPPPVQEHYFQGSIALESACDLFIGHHVIDGLDANYYLEKVIMRLNNGIACQKPSLFNSKSSVTIVPEINKVIHPEGYQIKINQQGIKITYSQYSGYVYALQSLWQIVKEGKIRFCHIKDEPQVDHRGIMIDSARHFLSYEAIKRVIVSMPLSKLNILHWHIVDDESFPIKLDSHPQLAQSGSYSPEEVYTTDQIKDLIRQAKLNGVKIIPEIDTPAHVRVWGLAPQWKSKNITIACNGGTGYNGQFDVSKPEVFKLAKDVVRQVNKLFADSPYIHLGGDEVSSNCWNLRPDIQNFMKQNNIKDYGELQMYWRQQIKSVMFPERRVVFWRNDNAKIKIDDNDILHYWGAQADVARVSAGSEAQIILSPSDLLYINKGQGNLWMNGTQGVYPVWKQIYKNFTVFPSGIDKQRILGAQVTLWGEVSNEDTLENNLWIRSSSFAFRVWSPNTLQTYQLVEGLVKIQKALNTMGVAASPFVSQFCQSNAQKCFADKIEETDALIAQDI